MKKAIVFTFLLFTFSFLIISCHCKKKAASTTVTAQKKDFEKEGYTKATVIAFELDGCKFLILLEDQKRLEPVNLSPDFQKDQLAVWIKYAIKKDGVSICQAGQMVDLTDIQLRK